MTFRRHRADPLPGHVSGAARRKPGREGAEDGLWSLEATNIRDFATDKHRSVDDTPAGGARAWCFGPTCSPRRSTASPRPPDARADPARRAADAGARARTGGGRRGDPAVRPLRGIRRADLRARPLEPVSVGDYVLSGGELGAMVDPRRLRKAASRGNGRGLQRRGRELQTGASRISALYPTSYMGRAHDPRSAAVGGSCEDRGVATRPRGRRYTAMAAGPDRAPRGRIAGTALWRAATRYEG